MHPVDCKNIRARVLRSVSALCLAVACIALAIVLVSCPVEQKSDGSGSQPQIVPVTGVKIVDGPVEITRIVLSINQQKYLTKQVGGKVEPANATDPTISWNSDKPEIASVDAATGEVTITAQANGTTNIIATTTDGSKTANIEVTVTDDTIITTEEELKKMAEDPAAKYILGKDITLTQSWEPVGESMTPFTGTLDGNAFTIKELTIDKSDKDYVGLIGYNEGTITNIGVEIGADGVVGQDYVGALAGWNKGTVVGAVKGPGAVTGRNNVGGLVGTTEESVTGYSTADVTATEDNAGGLVGNNSAQNTSQTLEITGYASGKIRGTNSVGGLVGYHRYGTVTGYATGKVEGTDNGFGGLGGQVFSTFTGYSRGSVDAGTEGGRNFGKVFGVLSDAAKTNTTKSYYSDANGESDVTGGDPAYTINEYGTAVTISTATTHTFNFTFGSGVGEWIFHPGKWPSINLPADAIFDEVRGDKQPIDP